MKRAITAVLIVSSLGVIAAVRAQSPSGMSGKFQSPSGNIFCIVNRYGKSYRLFFLIYKFLFYFYYSILNLIELRFS